MEEFIMEIRITYKFPIKSPTENDLWLLEPEELRGLAYKNLPTPASNRKIEELTVLDIERRPTGDNTIPFPTD